MTLPEKITTIEEAKNLLDYLHGEGLAFHPEDNAEDLVGPAFSQADAARLNSLMEDIYNLPGNDGRSNRLAFDPCEYLLYLSDKDENPALFEKHGVIFTTLDHGHHEVNNTDLFVSDLNSEYLPENERTNMLVLSEGETEIFRAETWEAICEKIKEPKPA